MAKSSSKQYLKSCYVAFVLSLAYFTVLKVTALNLELTFIIFSTISVLIVGMLTPLTFVFSGKIVTDEIENARPDETPINIPPAIKKRHISSNDMRNNVLNRKQSSEHHYTHNATIGEFASRVIVTEHHYTHNATIRTIPHLITVQYNQNANINSWNFPKIPLRSPQSLSTI